LKKTTSNQTFNGYTTVDDYNKTVDAQNSKQRTYHLQVESIEDSVATPNAIIHQKSLKKQPTNDKTIQTRFSSSEKIIHSVDKLVKIHSQKTSTHKLDDGVQEYNGEIKRKRFVKRIYKKKPDPLKNVSTTALKGKRIIKKETKRPTKILRIQI
jgi:hypothetical protein